MGIFGGSSKSSSNTTNNSSGFSEIAGQAVVVQGSGNTVSLSDHGAINSAFGFAGEALKYSETIGSQAVRDAGQAVGAAMQAVSESRKSESENVASRALPYLMYAALALAGAWAVRGVWGAK